MAKQHNRMTVGRLTAAQRQTAWGMITPSLVIIFALSIYPLLYTLVLSLSQYNLIKPKNNGFVGLSQ